MPLVQKAVSDYLKSAEILNSIPSDEVIAIGAAKQVLTNLTLTLSPLKMN